jgi:hypothetical protein
VPPVALILSVMGWVRGENRATAIVGIVISALVLLVFWGGLSLLILCR